MQELNSLSRLGFGGYRVSVESRQHQEALYRALALGCNLIDTSANYMNGGSERLVGQVLEANPEYDAFIVTKGGYVQGDNFGALQRLNRMGHAREGLVQLSDGAYYSIHPDFLETQIEQSSQRLRRRQIDCFMLHNPEHLFTLEIGRKTIHGHIRRAFEFLEEMVASGRIRYYGVSSNTLPISDEGSTLSLCDLIATAEGVSADPAFKLIQFPFNLLETGALEPRHDGKSLIDSAKAHGIITLTNRPLNAISNGVAIRLATYEEAIPTVESDRASQCALDDCLQVLTRRLVRLGLKEDPAQLAVIQLLQKHRLALNGSDAVDQLFREMFYPLLCHLYPDGVPAADHEVFQSLRKAILASERASTSQRALMVRQDLVARGVLDESDDRALAVLACENYLRAGVDHVLVGMRDSRYVESLRGLFGSDIGKSK